MEEGDDLLVGLLCGCAAESDGFEGPSYSCTIDIANILSPGIPGKTGDKPEAQASSVVVLQESASKRHSPQ